MYDKLCTHTLANVKDSKKLVLCFLDKFLKYSLEFKNYFEEFVTGE